MTAPTLVSTWTVEEVEASIRRTNDHFHQAGEHLIEARREMKRCYDAQGWMALGYGTWRAFASERYSYSVAHCYRLLTAAQIAVDAGVEELPIPERVLRPLAPFDGDARKVLLDFADTWAENNGVKLTAGIVEAAVDTMGEALTTGTWQDDQGGQHPLAEKLDADLTARVIELKKRASSHFNPRGYVARGKQIKGRVENGRLILPPIDIPNDVSNFLIGDAKDLRVSVWFDAAPLEDSGERP